MGRLRFATVWLGGCSGCHMSFLDLDEWLIDLAKQVDVVFSPLADVKQHPVNVDLVLVEGAVANDENLHMIQTVRARTKSLVALGDCAVTGNVTALRNPLGTALEVLRPVYGEKFPDEPQIVPRQGLLEQSDGVDSRFPDGESMHEVGLMLSWLGLAWDLKLPTREAEAKERRSS